MAGMKYLFQNMNVMNGLLAAALAAVVYFNVVPFLYPDAQMSLPAAKKTVERPGIKAAAPQNYTPVNYAVISEQNLFHPERIIPPEKKEEKVIPKPELVLYGVLITDDKSLAFMEDKKTPYSTPGRGQRQRVLKKGDQFSGYTLTEIAPNYVVFAKGNEKMTVKLDEGGKRKPGTATATARTTSTVRPGVSSPAAISQFTPGPSPSSTSRPQRPLWK